MFKRSINDYYLIIEEAAITWVEYEQIKRINKSYNGLKPAVKSTAKLNLTLSRT